METYTVPLVLCIEDNSSLRLYCQYAAIYQQIKVLPEGQESKYNDVHMEVLESMPLFGRIYIFVSEWRFYFSYPKAEEFDLYLVTYEGI